MIILGIDTEITRFCTQKLPPRDPKQGRICELALRLCKDDGTVIDNFCTLIKPDGWEMSPEAEAIHGHSIEDCRERGIEADLVFARFREMMDLADIVVAHNAPFDRRHMEMEARAVGRIMPNILWHCTMKQATQVCKAAGVTNSLANSLRVVCGRELVGAHKAGADLEACLDIYFELKRRKADPIDGSVSREKRGGRLI